MTEYQTKILGFGCSRVGTDFWVCRKRAKGLSSDPKKGGDIFCIRKGIFIKSLLQKGILAQNRAQKGKRAIHARHAVGILKLVGRVIISIHSDKLSVLLR